MYIFRHKAVQSISAQQVMKKLFKNNTTEKYLHITKNASE